MRISERKFLALSGLDPERLNLWIDEEWLIPGKSAEEFDFANIDIARARFIRDLQENFGVNNEGVGIVLHLVDQIHGIRRTLAEMRQLVDAQSE
ncbi:chaperone modulator CbpM [soil metagenome]|jgi:chaperone modulatory protein CbpM